MLYANNVAQNALKSEQNCVLNLINSLLYYE